MTRQHRPDRNRSNAAASTGPRTAGGKAISAQNARRHGATARLDPQSVAGWARVILDAPDLAPRDITDPDERTRHALSLAAAEVRRSDCEAALAHFEAEVERFGPAREQALGALSEVTFALIGGTASLAQVRTASEIMGQLQGSPLMEFRTGNRQHRLLKRYLREAETARRSALRAWTAMVAREAA